MLVLIIVGFAAGVITSLSPCVLPVLPVVLASTADRPRTPGADGAPDSDAVPAAPRRLRPYGVVAGLVLSFSASILFGSLILSALHLPQDLLRDAGIVVLVIIGISLLDPRLARLLERPFERLPSRKVNPDGNGIVLGLGLGLLFVPCAGPVLATIAVVGATHHIGFGAVILTIAFGIGVGVPLLAVALAGDAITRRTGILRRRARTVRIASGLVMILAAVAIGLNLANGLQTHVPGYTNALQNSIETETGAGNALKRLTNSGTAAGPGAAATTAPKGGSDTATDAPCTEGGTTLENCGEAPALTGITGWLNTPGDAPLTPGRPARQGRADRLLDLLLHQLPADAAARRGLVQGYQPTGWSSSACTRRSSRSSTSPRIFAATRPRSGSSTRSRSTTTTRPGTPTATSTGRPSTCVDATGEVRHVTFGEGDYGATESADPPAA